MLHLNTLYYQDLFYAEPCFNKYSMTKMTETQMKFSEAVKKIYPGCVPTKDFRIASDTAPKVNLAKLKDILLSTEEKLLKEN